MRSFGRLRNWTSSTRQRLVVMVPPAPLERKNGKKGKKKHRNQQFWHYRTLRIGKRASKTYAAVWVGFEVEDVVRAMAAAMVSQGEHRAGDERAIRNDIVANWRIYTIDLGTEPVADLRLEEDLALGDGDLKKYVADDTPGWRLMDRASSEGFAICFGPGFPGPGGAAWRALLDVGEMDDLVRSKRVRILPHELSMPRKLFPIVRKPYPPDTVEAKLMEYIDREALSRFLLRRVAPTIGTIAAACGIASTFGLT